MITYKASYYDTSKKNKKLKLKNFIRKKSPKMAIQNIVDYLSNPNKNPLTKRKIKKGSKTQKNIDKFVRKATSSATSIQSFIRRYLILQRFGKLRECYPYIGKPLLNEVDPISLNDLTNLSKYKIIIFNLDGKYVGFEVETYQSMIRRNINICPYTRLPFSQKDVDNNVYSVLLLCNLGVIETLERQLCLSIDKIAQEVFYDFSLNNIFLDPHVFLKLELMQLQKLHYELKDLFYKNTTSAQRSEISNEILFFESDNFTSDILLYQRYLLENIKKVINPTNVNFKYHCIYIMLGGLTLVCQEYNEYRNYIFDFVS